MFHIDYRGTPVGHPRAATPRAAHVSSDGGKPAVDARFSATSHQVGSSPWPITPLALGIHMEGSINGTIHDYALTENLTMDDDYFVSQ